MMLGPSHPLLRRLETLRCAPVLTDAVEVVGRLCEELNP
jgi:hypothetical protein